MQSKIKNILHKIWNACKIQCQKIKKICGLLVTICTLVTAVASVVIAQQALEVSKIALKTSSSATEPILDIDVDWYNDEIEVKNETYDIFQIKDVSFGLVRTIAVIQNDGDKISSVEVEENSTGFNLEHGHTTGTDCSDADAEKYNKKFKLSFDQDNSECLTSNLDLLEEKIEKDSKSYSCNYWGVSPNYNYRYIIVEYEDVYGNRRRQYYIYKCEYATTWRMYKLSEKQFDNYTQSIIYNYDENKILEKLFSASNFKQFEHTKYASFSEWNNWEQFEKK